eukprot:1175820-Prorocentrum_minimum.AAC.3
MFRFMTSTHRICKSARPNRRHRGARARARNLYIYMYVHGAWCAWPAPYTPDPPAPSTHEVFLSRGVFAPCCNSRLISGREGLSARWLPAAFLAVCLAWSLRSDIPDDQVHSCRTGAYPAITPAGWRGTHHPTTPIVQCLRLSVSVWQAEEEVAPAAEGDEAGASAEDDKVTTAVAADENSGDGEDHTAHYA